MADERVLPAIDFIREQIDKLLVEIAKQKDLANTLATAAGLEPVYTDIERPGESRTQTQSKIVIQPDHFANYSAPSAAAHAYLEMRSQLKPRTATLEVIFDALSQGGYRFSSNATEAKNGLKISLGKDYRFLKLPNEQYGLTAWYPNANIKRERAKKGADPNGSKPSDTKSLGELPLALSEIDEKILGIDGDDDESEQESH